MFYLKKLTINDGEDLYNVLQDIGPFEGAFTNEVSGESYDFYKQWVIKMDDWDNNRNIPPGFVRQTIYWFYLDDTPIGVGKLRWTLTDEAKSRCGGNVGYAIAKKFRNNGYGKILLELLIQKAKKLGFKELVASVLKDNVYSNKIMNKLGGKVIYENTERFGYLLYKRVNMKYIIMCGGKYNDFETPRQLTKINGEPLVERTIRLLRELGIDDIAVSTSADRDNFDYLDVPVLKFDNTYTARKYNDFDGYWCDAFYKTDEPICYLMGDTYYSRAALKTIIDYETNDILFFGTDTPFAIGYPKWYSEPLAFKVYNQKKFQACCDKFRTLQDLGPGKWPFSRKPISWELAQIISNWPLNKIIVRTPIFVGIHDFASDVDEAGDSKILERIVKEYNIV